MKNKMPFSMSYGQARRFFFELANEKACFYGRRIKLDENIDSSFGETFDRAFDGDGSAHIGFADFVLSASNWCGVKKVSADVFAREYITLEHEIRHVAVFNAIANKTVLDELSNAHVAKQGSRSYYLNNRYKYLTEIDAEVHGIISAYKGLCTPSSLDGKSLMSREEAEGAICNYVNSQCENFSYYINLPSDGKYRTINDIYRAFDEAYELATSKEPVVRDEHGLPDISKRYREIRPSWKDDEAIAQCLDEHGRLKPEFHPVFNMMWDASNADKDCMVASLTLNAMPELKQFYGERVADELRPEKVFGDVWSSSVQRGAESRERVDIALVNDVGDELDHQLE